MNDEENCQSGLSNYTPDEFEYTPQGLVYINQISPNPGKAEPSKCLCIHAIDGYETYFIDDNTIGVRPTWFDVKDCPKNAPVILTDGDDVLGGSICEDGCVHIQNPDGYPFMFTAFKPIKWMPMPQKYSEK